MRSKKALAMVLILTLLIPTTSYADPWTDVWKAMYWLYLKVIKNEQDIQELEKRPPAGCQIESGRIAIAAAAFPQTVELNCFEETDELVVVNSGWYYDESSNRTLSITHYSEWETDHWIITFSVYKPDGLSLSPTSLVNLRWIATVLPE